MSSERSRLRIPAMAAAVAAVLSPAAEAKVFLTVQEALARTFPSSRGCETLSENRYLTGEQMKRAQELSGLPSGSALVVRYGARCGGKPAGHAYTDTHRVRTHPETLWIAVDAQGKVSCVEVLSFDEPLEYMPRPEWYGTYSQQALTPELQLKRKIPAVTGASLTSQATVQATRRALAIDQVLREADEEAAKAGNRAKRK